MTSESGHPDGRCRRPLAPVGRREPAGGAVAAWLAAPGLEHINFHGFYPFHRPDLGEGLRDLRDPAPDQEED